MHILNLGILAHVDAGKTTLTERLLLTAGAITTLGSVDAGTTQTDSLALERQRGITIRAAVVALTLGDLAVNLIDTPGHPDFIAEVERSLTVLDGAVLVISAVEGVQAQTVILMRALRRLQVPTLLFVNKIDRAGANPDRVLAEIRERLTTHVAPMGRVVEPGRASSCFRPFADTDPDFADDLLDVLIEHDDALLGQVLDVELPGGRPRVLAAELAAHTAAAHVHPVFFGSAATGAGIAELGQGIRGLLPSAAGDPSAAASGSVFKVERGANGEKIAYVRMFAGVVHVRDQLHLGGNDSAKVTAVKVFEHGALAERGRVSAGQIGTLYGLRDVRVGDWVGHERPHRDDSFAPPSMETAVVARDPAQSMALHHALLRLADQDPLINVRQDDVRKELFLSLYGEVQKEVIEHSLRVDDGIDVVFRATTVMCVERVAGDGHALARMGDPSNPFMATIGLLVEPAAAGTGIDFRVDVDVRSLPMYVYKSVDAFHAAMTEYVRLALEPGLHGWRIPDCVVTLTESGYHSPITTARDFRDLTPILVRDALVAAGTVVCEPIHRFRLDAPADSLTAIYTLLGRHRAQPAAPVITGSWCSVAGDIPAAEVQPLRGRLPGTTHGAGVLEADFDRFEPVACPNG